MLTTFGIQYRSGYRNITHCWDHADKFDFNSTFINYNLFESVPINKAEFI